MIELLGAYAAGIVSVVLIRWLSIHDNAYRRKVEVGEH